MELKTILQNIELIRKSKGYSHEYMAMRLDISQAAYSKIERNTTKLNVERLLCIAEILEVELEEVLGIDAINQFTQNNKEHSTDYLQQTVNLYNENKEQLLKTINVYEERIKDKDLLIKELRNSLSKVK